MRRRACHAKRDGWRRGETAWDGIPRKGVYFEAGIGLGLNRTVVFTSRRKEFDNGHNVHFDTRPDESRLVGRAR